MRFPDRLDLPPTGDPDGVRAWTARTLGDLAREGPDGVAASPRFRGGQRAAHTALAGLDLTGYAARRNEVLPLSARGASGLSPYVRHGLLPLPALWRAVAGAPARDRDRFREELLWQEYARHLYARLGPATTRPLRYEPASADPGWTEPWPETMACVRAALEELSADGWLVNQVRMWLSSQWTVRAGADWRTGEDRFFADLLDGSRAANRLGWQWTVGAGTGKPYGFSRWQVTRRAPALCGRCALAERCPIEAWPAAAAGPRLSDPDPRLRHDPDVAHTAGPVTVAREPRDPEWVWLTAESLGDDDPALRTHPERPAVFVFDAPLLARLGLSGKRLVFLAECLADLAARRELVLLRGDPVALLSGHALAVTFAPVPGFRRRAAGLAPVALFPWPWLVRPDAGTVSSFSAWRRRVRVPK
ncbi:FAD-binding domain-containing protein [Conexibacter sp. DBS9H8]|uniref:FAD-binding domain-containing protein n=1 Tax=Conexibacter sp. DBS9H8 TaxID=2937801 RepID=UPI00200C1FF8|nr:FAD-binding domain-containing protein [Conexibacter sp. DBS9H8]